MMVDDDVDDDEDYDDDVDDDDNHDDGDGWLVFMNVKKIFI